MNEKNRPRYWHLILIAVICVLFLLLLIFTNASAVVSVNALSEWTFLTAEKGYYQEAIQSLLQEMDSPLANYSETVGDAPMSASTAIWTASQDIDFGMNPKVLIATLAVENRLTQKPKEHFTLYVQGMAETLWQGYTDYINGSRAVTLADSQTFDFGTAGNAPTFALASYLGKVYTNEADVVKALVLWSQTYQELFNIDPMYEKPKIVAHDIPVVVPFLQLPFTQPAENFVRVTSFFDHLNPGISDDSLLRFDGTSYSGASFSGCALGVNCYGGHNALDYRTGAGMPILAAADGTVVYKYYNTDPAQGKVDSGLYIDHNNGYRTAYWHMDPIQVNYGDTVKAGQVIGLSGNIGMSSGPHLHFGLRLVDESKAIDPYGWWSATSTDPWRDSYWMWKGDLIADNGEAQAQFFYYDYWWREPRGYGGDSYWTYGMTDASKSSNWGMWGTFIDKPGPYNVFAYWPSGSENTNSARYQIYHAGGMSTVKANQSTGGDKFTLLGNYYFNRGVAVVMMRDLTDDSSKRLYFDAVKWEPATGNPVPLPISLGTFDDADSHLSYSGSWMTDQSSGSYLQTRHYSNTAGNTVSFNFEGQKLSLLYSVGPSRGLMEVKIDGVLTATINQSASQAAFQKRWDSLALEAGTHSVTLKHLSGGTIDLDALVIANVNPTPAPTIPADVLLEGNYDDYDQRILFEGDWKSYQGDGGFSDTYLNTLHYSATVGNTTRFAFQGTRFSLVYTGFHNRGVVDIYVDDIFVASLNQYSPNTEWQKRWQSSTFLEGVHTVELRHAQGAYIDVDEIIVGQPPDNTPVPTATQTSPATMTPAPGVVNLAFNKSATQSSNYMTSLGLAPNAVDGNTDGIFTNKSVTHTQNELQSWWQVDLGKISNIHYINVWNRTDCCGERLSNFYVLVSDVPFTSSNLDTVRSQSGVSAYYLSGVGGHPSIVMVNRSGRYVRVQLSGTNPLSLAEVEVMGLGEISPTNTPVPTSTSTSLPTATSTSTPVPTNTPTPVVTATPPGSVSNLAKGKSAAQSSNYMTTVGLAPNAVDGNTDGVFVDKSVTHTKFELQPWWQVDLGRQVDIQNINIWNRSDCCSERLSDFYVLVSNLPFSSGNLDTVMLQGGVSSYLVNGVGGYPSTVQINRSGRYVRVQLTGNNALSLAEVEVMGTESNVSNEPFQVQADNPFYLPNFAHPEDGNNWMGIGGQVFDLSGTPMNNVVVMVGGMLNGTPLEVISITGINSSYGPGGYDIKLSSTPLASTGSLNIALYDLNGKQLSAPFFFSTYADPAKNLILINFQQIANP
jgi:murein DD-endopeptidase MepM/ murein hydrolase activator NlpD